MNDPLRAAPSPFEVLGVDHRAGDAEVTAAFGARLGHGGNPQTLLAARKTLQDPVARALADALDYWEEDFGVLSPSPFDDSTILEPDRRWQTARVWEEQLKARFPDLAAAHSLAVLWRWWADYASADPRRAGNGDGALSLDQIWQMTIGYWSMLANADTFWQDRARGDSEVAGAARERVVADLRGRLYAACSTCRESGDREGAAALERLDVALDTEVQMGKVISACVRTPNGQITCGPLLLGHLQLLDAVTGQVDQALAGDPGREELKTLREALSPLSHVAILIDKEQAQRALDALGELPAAERGSAEAQALRTRALELLARQQEEVGDFDTALATWKKALSEAAGEAEREAIRAQVVSAGLQHANELADTQRPQAIALLKKALAVADDEKLRLTLADLYFQNGLETFLAAQKKIEDKGPTKTSIAAMNKGLRDLERAADLGHTRAGEQAEAGRQVVASLPSPEIAELVAKAMAATQKEDWKAAIGALEKAVALAGPDPPESLKENLAVLLVNRGVQTANKASAMMAKAGGSGPATVEQALAMMEHDPLQVLEVWRNSVGSSSSPSPASQPRGRRRWIKRAKGWLASAVSVMILIAFWVVIGNLGAILRVIGRTYDSHPIPTIVGGVVVLLLVGRAIAWWAKK